MPTSSSPSTSKRLLALLSLLQTRRDWPARVLATRLQVSERTVRRDVDRLRELDYTIDATRGPDGGYRLVPGAALPPMLLDDEQAVAIALALRAAPALGAGLEEAAERALGTMGRLLPGRLARRIEHLGETTAAVPAGGATRTDPAVLLRIGEAIRAREELRFDYDSPACGTGDVPAVRRVEPHHLLLSAGRWYLLGWSAERDDWRTYRVDRLRPRTHTGRRFAPRPVPGGDAAAFLAARFRGSDGRTAWPVEGEAVLSVPLEAVSPFLGDGTAEREGPDRCRVRLGSWSWPALAAALLRFDADVAEVEPAELRDAFADLGRRATVAGGGAPERSRGV